MVMPWNTKINHYFLFEWVFNWLIHVYASFFFYLAEFKININLLFAAIWHFFIIVQICINDWSALPVKREGVPPLPQCRVRKVWPLFRWPIVEVTSYMPQKTNQSQVSTLRHGLLSQPIQSMKSFQTGEFHSTLKKNNLMYMLIWAPSYKQERLVQIEIDY